MDKTELGATILRLRDQGRSYREIVKTLGCSSATVSYWCSPEGRAKCIKRTHDRRHKLVRMIQEKKHYQPCADCGQKYPYWVMQFDHRGDKRFNISDFKKRRIGAARLAEEMEKCDIVCANCHAERTHKRSLGIII